MNLLKNAIKKQSLILLSSLAFTGFILNLSQRELQAYPNTVAACTGSIPSGIDTCLVDPTSYELDIYRVYSMHCKLCVSDIRSTNDT